MENLTFNSNKLLDTNNFVRVGDLSYFEGPLLSLFQELNSGHFYLFDWVDRDDKFNRWMIYRVSPKILLHFINCKISHFELFERRPDKEVYFADIDSRNKLFFDYDSYEIKGLPQNYYPNSDNFFEISDCKHFEKIKSVIINSLSRQKSENEYSIVHILKVLKHREVKSAYFNRIQNKVNSISYPVRHIKHINIQVFSNLALNNIKGISFKSYSTRKKQELQKKKKYANQYN